MSLSAVETALVDYVGDVIVNECGRPVPEHVLRYHGELPHYCCTEDGVLAIDWTLETFVSTFPTTPQRDPCAGLPVATLSIKYFVCWPAITFVDGHVVMDTDTWDSEAAMLADVADCVARALMRLRCDPTNTDPFVQAVLAESGRQVQFIDAAPMPVRGLCAGVRWRMYAAVREPSVAS